MMASIGVGVVSAVIGLYISYYHDIASGPAIVLTGAVAFAVLAIGMPNRYRHSRTTV
jgi:manganese/iron transport system permease protein